MHKHINFSSYIDLYTEIDSFMMSQGWSSANKVMTVTSAKHTETINGKVYTKGIDSFGIYSSSSIMYPKANFTSSCTYLLLSIENDKQMISGKSTNGRYENGTHFEYDPFHEEYNDSYVLRHCVGALLPTIGEAYFNYSEKGNTISCVISLKFMYYDEFYYQHIAFGTLNDVKDGNVVRYVTGSRSDFAMMPDSVHSKITMGEIDSTSNPLFGTANIPSTICEYIHADGAIEADRNKLTSIFASAGTRLYEKRMNSGLDKKWWSLYGTGKSLCTSIIDVGYFDEAPNVPNYKYLQSNTCGDYGRMTLFSEGIANAMPINFFIQRDPYELENYSYIGHVSHVCAVSIRNMADCSIHELVTKKDGYMDRKKFQVFPHCLRNGRHGYDGIAIEYDDTDYGNGLVLI